MVGPSETPTLESVVAAFPLSLGQSGLRTYTVRFKEIGQVGFRQDMQMHLLIFGGEFLKRTHEPWLVLSPIAGLHCETKTAKTSNASGLNLETH
jgi:hypothetical protein